MDANQIATGLWIGSAPAAGTVLGMVVDTLVLCAAEYQPRSASFPGVTVVRAPLTDDGKPPTRSEMRLAVEAGYEVFRRITSGRRVLVTCYMGLNRSALVCGLALRMAGITPKDIVATIRAARGQAALSNPYFVDMIRTFEPQTVLTRSSRRFYPIQHVRENRARRASHDQRLPT